MSKKLSEYPLNTYERGCINCVFLGDQINAKSWVCNKHGYHLNGLDRLCKDWEGNDEVEEDAYLIPAPVAEAVDAVIEAAKATEKMQWVYSCSWGSYDDGDKADNMHEQLCEALDKYREVAKDETNR